MFRSCTVGVVIALFLMLKMLEMLCCQKPVHIMMVIALHFQHVFHAWLFIKLMIIIVKFCLYNMYKFIIYEY